MAASTGLSQDGTTLCMPPVPTAPSQARQFVASRLQEWQLSQCEDVARLVVSELVTNALLHARTDMVVALLRSNGSVVVEVSDESPVQPVPRSFSPFAGTGRGLNLVAALAEKWGVRPDQRGKTVWATLSILTAEEFDQYDTFDVDAVDAL